jgi:hypothetical protein
MNKEVKQLVRSIEHIEGIELRNGGSHFLLYKEGKFVTVIPGTPSDRRWRENTMATLRKAGITPAVHPKGPSKRPKDMLGVTDLRKRVTELPNRAAFARFLVDDMMKLQPELRTYKSFESAQASLHEFVHNANGGLSGWTHMLLDQAMREWEARHLVKEESKEEAQPVITDEEIDEAIAMSVAKVSEGTGVEMTPIEVPADGTEHELPVEEEPPTVPGLSAMPMTELARDHEELTGRIAKLAESVKTLTAQLDELVEKRQSVSNEILSRLSETEVMP